MTSSMSDSLSAWTNFISKQNLLPSDLLQNKKESQTKPYIAVIADKLSPEKKHSPSLELLEVSGPDAQKFLQGQLSCDMKLLNDSQCQLGACINLKGRIISNFIVILWSKDGKPSYLLICPPEMSSITAIVLKKYAIFSKVSIEAANPDLLVSISNISVLEKHPALATTIRQFSIPGSQRCLLIGHSEGMLQLWQTLEHFQYLDGYSCWQQQNINEALVFIEKSCTEIFTPQEINFELVQGINFSKGCYTGQEVVARLHYRGVSKRRAFIAEITVGSNRNIEAPPETAAEIFNNKGHSVGHLLAKNYIGNQRYAGLISLSLEERKKFIENPENNPLQFANPTAIITRVSPPPYSLEKQ
jgi:tRNA-modifying protein YgfZ